MIFSWKEISIQIEEEVAKSAFDGHPSELYDPISYILNLGGKRIRPTLCLLSTQMFKGDFKALLAIALALLDLFWNIPRILKKEFTLLAGIFLNQKLRILLQFENKYGRKAKA